MYLVELRPGKEELYRTGDELAAAIRSGDVDMHSRIYHRATSKWISVTLHPQYKAIVSERPASPALPPLPPLERSTWTFFNDSADTLAGANDPSPEGEGKSDDGDAGHPFRRPLALSVMGGLLILGLQLAASGPRPPWSPPDSKTAAPARFLPASSPAPAPAVATVSLASSGTNWVASDQEYYSGSSSGSEPASAVPASAEPATPAATTPAPAALPAAPKFHSKMLLSEAMARPARATTAPVATVPARAVSALLQGWTAAHDSARTRLESGIRVARLNQLFALSRLSPGGGVTETRMSLAGVVNFVRVYRQQEAAIEREYQDSFTVVSKQRGWTPAQAREWYARPSARESPTLIALTSRLMEGIDSLLGVLDAQAGTYAVTPNVIRFEDPSAAREYAALRQEILSTVEAAKAAGGAAQPGPMSYLLQAIGATRLPVAI